MKGYRATTLKKAGGGSRVILAPSPGLLREQRLLLREIEARCTHSPWAHGFVKGRSILTNASIHCGAEYVASLDLSAFFHSVTLPRVRGILLSLGFTPAQAHSGALLSTAIVAPSLPRCLPQGAATSPCLANLAAKRLDSRLAGAAAAEGFAFTRYADDLTFSGPTHPVRLLRLAHRIIQEEGFNVNARKTRVARAPSLRLVTGLDVGGPVPKVAPHTLALFYTRRRSLTQEQRAGHRAFFLSVSRLAQRPLGHERKEPQHEPL